MLKEDYEVLLDMLDEFRVDATTIGSKEDGVISDAMNIVEDKLEKAVTPEERIKGKRSKYENMSAIEKEKKKIEIDITSEDCEDLIDGKEFNWTYETTDGTVDVDVHLYNPDA